MHTHVRWNAAKAVSFELLVLRVGHHDIAHLKDCFFIMIHLKFAKFVETAIVVNFEIAKRKINCDAYVQFPSVS